MTARTGSVTIGAPAERVFDYFANPRNLVMANNRGPVIDQSVPSTGPGSWAVLKFDQLQLRVEYETWERPTKLAAVLHYSGIGSGNRVDRFAYDFAGAGDHNSEIPTGRRSFGEPARDRRLAGSPILATHRATHPVWRRVTSSYLVKPPKATPERPAG